MIYKVYYVI